MRVEGRAGAERPRDPAAPSQPNIVALGQLLYSRYLFAFEIAGLILLVAMIGAIVLTHRSRGDTRTPKVSQQIAPPARGCDQADSSPAWARG